jgi:hypothetical protein
METQSAAPSLHWNGQELGGSGLVSLTAGFILSSQSKQSSFSSQRNMLFNVRAIQVDKGR